MPDKWNSPLFVKLTAENYTAWARFYESNALLRAGTRFATKEFQMLLVYME